MKKLLLADDSITIQKVIGITFANDDFDLTIVGDGDAALAKVPEVAPDIVLADVYMPGKNGYELCEAIKSNPASAHVPVLLLTGTFEAFDEEKAKSVGADEWIAKPFESQSLIEKVKNLLEQGAAAPAPAAVEEPAAVAAPEPALEEPAAEQDDDIWGSVSFEDEEEEVSETVDDGDIWGDVSMEDEPEEIAVAEEDVVEVDDDEEEVVFLDDEDILIEEDDDESAPAFVEPEAVVEEVIPEPEPAPAPTPVAPPVVEPTPAPEPEPAPPVAAPAPTVAEAPVSQPQQAGSVDVSPELVEEIVKKVAAQLVERIAWEVVPDLAESLIKDEIRKIKETL